MVFVEQKVIEDKKCVPKRNRASVAGMDGMVVIVVVVGCVGSKN